MSDTDFLVELRDELRAAAITIADSASTAAASTSELPAHGATTMLRASSRGPDEVWVDVAADATRFSPVEHPPSRC